MLDVSAMRSATRQAAEWISQQDWGAACQDWFAFAQQVGLARDAAVANRLVYWTRDGLRIAVQLEEGALATAMLPLARSEDMYGWPEEAYEAAVDEYQSAFDSAAVDAEAGLGKATAVGDPEADGFECEFTATRAAVWRARGFSVEFVLGDSDDQGPLGLSFLVWPARRDGA
jgi:hypothetical protein